MSALRNHTGSRLDPNPLTARSRTWQASRMASEVTTRAAAILRRLRSGPVANSFILGLSAPGLLFSPPTQAQSRALRRGETVQHAWSATGAHLSRAMRQMDDERRTDRPTG